MNIDDLLRRKLKEIEEIEAGKKRKVEQQKQEQEQKERERKEKEKIEEEKIREKEKKRQTALKETAVSLEEILRENLMFGRYLEKETRGKFYFDGMRGSRLFKDYRTYYEEDCIDISRGVWEINPTKTILRKRTEEYWVFSKQYLCLEVFYSKDSNDFKVGLSILEMSEREDFDKAKIMIFLAKMSDENWGEIEKYLRILSDPEKLVIFFTEKFKPQPYCRPW